MIDLHKLFYPQSIAVIGASEGKLKWGSNIMTNIIDGGYEGDIYPVTVSRDSVFGYKACKSVIDIDASVDLAFIMTPAETIIGILKECVKKEIKNIVIISSGFSEAGEKGSLLEQELIEYATEQSINIVGPNTMGISNLACKLHGTGAHPRPDPGTISIIAQSGNVGNQIMLWAEFEKIGIGKFIGSGNEATIKVEDYLEYFYHDKDTSVILIYMEGVGDGRKFIEVAKKTTLEKPVIALKAGRTEGGSKAAQSHTGSMAGEFHIFESVMKQAGITIAMNPTELLELSAAFDSFPLPAGNRIGIVTLGGGWGVITADECEERGLILPPLPEDLKEKFDAKLPSFWSRANPVDLVGQPDASLFQESIEIMVSSDAFDAVVVLGLIGSARFGMRPLEAAYRIGYIEEELMSQIRQGANMFEKRMLDMILTLMNQYDKPIYPVSLAAFPEDEIMYYKNGSKYKVIVYKTPEEAVHCLSKQFLYSKFLRKNGIDVTKKKTGGATL